MTGSMPIHVATTINDMLKNCGQLEAGQHVVILSHVDGLYGGPNLVDEQAVAWLQTAVQLTGGHASTVWIDEPAKPYEWRIPEVVKATLRSADIFINNSFDLSTEEMLEFRDLFGGHSGVMIRNFATTAPLLASAWSRTPYELVCQIRHYSSSYFTTGEPWVLTDLNGTHLEGKIGAPSSGSSYVQPRTHWKPFPEWVFTPISLLDVEGELIFDRTLSWWARYIGVPPFFKEPIRLSIQGGRIKRFEGGEEAELLRRFLGSLEKRFGEAIYRVPALHGGVHPNAAVTPNQCLDVARRRWIEHSHTCNIHLHLGETSRRPDWPYMLHVTADLRQSTLKLGNNVVYNCGHLLALDHPEVKAVAERYPDRPGVDAEHLLSS